MSKREKEICVLPNKLLGVTNCASKEGCGRPYFCIEIYSKTLQNIFGIFGM